MEFFELTSGAQFVLNLFGFSLIDVETLEEALQVIYQQLWLCLYIAAGVYLVCLVLGGLGLMKMAKKEGKKHAWMGFIPFLNTWYAGHIAGEAQFFGQKMKRAGLYAAIAEGLYCAISALSVASTFILLPYSKVEVDTTYSEEGIQYIVTDPSRIPQSLRWMYDFDLIFSLIGLVLNIVLIVFLCVIFIALFRKYFARSPFLMTFLCSILPFRGFVLFAVRNNTPVDYNAYLRRRMEEAMRRQNPYGYGPYNQGPYNNGPYNGGAYGAQPPRQPEEPFSDFGGQNGPQRGAGGENNATPPQNKDDPFSDF